MRSSAKKSRLLGTDKDRCSGGKKGRRADMPGAGLEAGAGIPGYIEKRLHVDSAEGTGHDPSALATSAIQLAISRARHFGRGRSRPNGIGQDSRWRRWQMGDRTMRPVGYWLAHEAGTLRLRPLALRGRRVTNSSGHTRAGQLRLFLGWSARAGVGVTVNRLELWPWRGFNCDVIVRWEDSAAASCRVVTRVPPGKKIRGYGHAGWGAGFMLCPDLAGMASRRKLRDCTFHTFGDTWS